MIEKKENGEILYTYLDQHFEPKENLSPYGLMDKWRIVPVGTAEYSSNMIASLAGHPEDITLSPNLEGMVQNLFAYARSALLFAHQTDRRPRFFDG